jgi:transcriptional regulator with XRE-family HTH domain
LRPPREWITQPGGLADALRGLRQDAGLTGEQLAERLGWRAASKVRQAENGHRILSPEDTRAWAVACGQPGEAERLLQMAAAAKVNRRQYMYQRSFAGVQEQLDDLWRQAAVISNFECFVIPGLLQTPAYTRYWFEAGSARSGGSGDVDEAVAARRRRQDILDEPGREFHFLLMESLLLTRPPVPDEVMAAQWDRVARAAMLPNVTVGIVPFSARIVPPVVASFVLLDKAAYLETNTSQTVLEGPESEYYGQIWGELARAALTGDEALALIPR